MTDLERFVELYQSIGVKLNVFTIDTGSRVILTTKKEKFDDDDDEEETDATSSEKFKGYEGFYTNIDFDKDGKFVEQGFWE